MRFIVVLGINDAIVGCRGLGEAVAGIFKSYCCHFRSARAYRLKSMSYVAYLRVQDGSR